VYEERVVCRKERSVIVDVNNLNPDNRRAVFMSCLRVVGPHLQKDDTICTTNEITLQQSALHNSPTDAVTPSNTALNLYLTGYFFILTLCLGLLSTK